MAYKHYFNYFKFNDDEVYFDAAATAIKPKEVIEAQLEYDQKIAANSHNTLFNNAYRANVILSDTRKMCANFIGAKNENEIIFTSGTTHSLNQIAFGMREMLTKDDEVVLTDLEHSSNLLPWMVLSEKIGFKIKYLPLKLSGEIDLEKIKEVVNKKTKVVSFASVSNTMGAQNDVKKITQVIKNIHSEIIVVVDAAQSVAHEPTNVDDWNIDFLAFSGHKMFAPFGIGILWGRKELLEKMEPIFYGGGNNSSIEHDSYTLAKIPYKFEAGTLNMSAIYGLKKAFIFIGKIGIGKIKIYEAMLKKHFIKKIAKLDQEKFTFYNLENESPIILFNVNGVNAQDFGVFLNKKYNISVRVGKHCARLSNNVIDTQTTIRASFSIFNSKSDIDRLVEALKHSDNWMETLI
ncbi:cysteine desulfurase / selenocysteine lyase [Spiroplasma chinense]|uniref:cysteine desulfurase n=1 Tax=Spiroplasma chinense TaxID=216932 RepID=A0A5B9Y4P5_9MOLU|nr:cysteine desulfurase [Spiroplasma chinense]QEH62138.1 cysteine desulfurase / selenocysteine lyase [Spiroplasma chinense]